MRMSFRNSILRQYIRCDVVSHDWIWMQSVTMSCYGLKPRIQSQLQRRLVTSIVGHEGDTLKLFSSNWRIVKWKCDIIVVTRAIQKCSSVQTFFVWWTHFMSSCVLHTPRLAYKRSQVVLATYHSRIQLDWFLEMMVFLNIISIFIHGTHVKINK